MIESLIPKREEPAAATPPVTPAAHTPSKPSETEQLKTQLQELKDIVAKLTPKPEEKSTTQTSTTEEKPEEKPTAQTPPTFPTSPTGATSSTDHRARFLEVYNRNPYLAATYLEKHPTEIAATTKELFS